MYSKVRLPTVATGIFSFATQLFENHIYWRTTFFLTSVTALMFKF
jgi:hypothetical protein